MVSWLQFYNKPVIGSLYADRQRKVIMPTGKTLLRQVEMPTGKLSTFKMLLFSKNDKRKVILLKIETIYII